jgi:hypothetical protein
VGNCINSMCKEADRRELNAEGPANSLTQFEVTKRMTTHYHDQHCQQVW